ncbi:MAG: FAD-binding protein [Promethearchaeia archaeon]
MKKNLQQKDAKINGEYNTIIIGSGAAGLNCALHLVEEGVPPNQIAILTENLGGGTSFNTGSDKQTYYKLSIIGKEHDSPIEMAQDFFAGGAMHGDIALVESTNSIREFFHLVHVGVPFPYDKYGGYVGYKTDNDPRQRATSIGPLTSQEMGKCLLKEVQKHEIPIFDKSYGVKILTSKKEPKQAVGVICLDLSKLNNEEKISHDLGIERLFRIFKGNNIVMGTGGPAILYKNSVYPKSQKGSMGLAIDAGCILQNLTESQFGLASVQFRWNVSGSYQQVIPRYFSIDEDGKEQEFLNKYFSDFTRLSKATFLKGYQWPFNPERVQSFGSSLIDLAVYYETEVLGRRVFLDFRRNPSNFDEEKMSKIALNYLQKSKALADTPLKRLQELNEDAIILYKNHNIDLKDEPLEIAVCNQHLNGGVQGDIWWETNIPHLFAIGEVNGSHGIHRPGGAALNSGQVGGLRAAQRIAHIYNDTLEMDNERWLEIANIELNSLQKELELLIRGSAKKEGKMRPNKMLLQIQNRMSQFGGIIRPQENLDKEIRKVEETLGDITQNISIESKNDILLYYRVKDALLTQKLFLEAIMDYHQNHGKSRGSYLIIRRNLTSRFEEKYISPPANLKRFKFITSSQNLSDQIQEISYEQEHVELTWEHVREIPQEVGWFENTWKKYQEEKIYQKTQN